MGSRRRSNTFTRFLEDIVDDTKGLVDDLLDRAKDLEDDARDAIVDVADDDKNDDKDDGEDGADVAALRKTLDELRAKIDELTALQQDRPG